MAGRDLSIVVPVYNEVANIGPLVASLGSVLSDVDWEVIFVDDNSPDGTAGEVRKLALEDDRVRLVLRIFDRGLAKACIQGLLSSKANLLCVMDGDGQHDPMLIQKLIDPLKRGDADVVSASRRLGEEVQNGALTPFRQRLSIWGNRACRWVLRRPVEDPLTGFFAMRWESFLDVAPRLGDPGFKLLFDILLNGPALRHREVPFDFGTRRSGRSKLDLSVAWQFGTYFLSTLTRGIIPTALVSFLFVGAIGVGVHLAMLFLALWAGAGFPVAQTIGALTAVISNFLLNNRLTFRDSRLSGLALATGFLKFLVISSVGLFANIAIATLTFQHLTHTALLASLAGILMDTLWKYAVSSRLVWR